MVAKNSGFSSWKLKRRQYGRLEHRRSVALNRAARHAQQEDDRSFETQLELVQKLDFLLKVHPWRKMKDAATAGAIAGLCVGLIWILSVKQFPVNSVALLVESDMVRMNLPDSEPWSWRGNLPIMGGTELSMSNLHRDDELVRLMESSSRSVFLKALHAEGGSQIRFGFDYDGFMILSRDRGSLKGDLEFLPDSGKHSYIGSFFSKDKPGVSCTLRFMPQAEMNLGDMAVTSVSSFREVPMGILESDREFKSSVLGGTIRFKDIDQEIALQPGDGLKIEGCKGRITVVAKPLSKRLAVRFDGNAARIIRDGRNLAPSLLSWGYHGKRPAFFSAIFLFFWGVAWRMRKWLFW